MKIHEYLAFIRKQKNIGQDKLSDALGVTRQTIYRIECGKQRLFLDQYIRICKELGISPAEPFLQMESDNIVITKDDLIQIKKINNWFNLFLHQKNNE